LKILLHIRRDEITYSIAGTDEDMWPNIAGNKYSITCTARRKRKTESDDFEVDEAFSCQIV
jgi:hypothetical protein